MLPLKYRTLSTKWLHIPIEVQHRELTSKMLLAFVAAENGYSTVIGEQSTLYRNISNLPKGVVHEHACGKTRPREDLFKTFHKAGHKVVANDDEAVSIYSIEELWCKARMSPELFTLCDQYHVWGQKQAEILADYMEVGLDAFSVTGSYRTDVWQPPITNTHLEAADEIRAKYGRYILLPSNFSSSFDPRGPEYHLNKAKEYKIVNNEADEKKFLEMSSFKDDVCNAYIQSLDRIVEAFPDHTLIIRPHPNESVENWNKAIGEKPRVEVIYEGEASPWLLGADVIYHNGCTTALEARLMGKNPVTFKPISDDRFDDTFLCNTGPIANDVDTLIGLIKQVMAGEELEYELKDDLENYILFRSGELASDRIIAEIDKLNPSVETFNYSASQYVHAIRELFRPNSRKKVSAAARRSSTLGNAPPKWPGLHMDEVNRLLAEFQKHLGRFDNVGVVDFKRRLFLVYPK